MNTRWSAMALPLVLIPAVLLAQPDDNRRLRARTFLAMRLAEELDLSEEKALRVSRIIREQDERRQGLRARRGAVEEKIRAELEKSPRDEAQLATLIGQARDLDREMALVPEEVIGEVAKLLTVEEQARLVLLRPEMQKQMQRALRRRFEARERRRGRFSAGE